MSTVPSVTLNNGVEMPAIGLGVFQTPPDVTTAAVEEALRLGYRHIDTAAAYANERALRSALSPPGCRTRRPNPDTRDCAGRDVGWPGGHSDC